MPLVLFSFVLNTETQEAVFSGNTDIQVALQILQQLAIANAISEARVDDAKEKKAVGKKRTLKKEV